ncbi:MAG UNVERIFIED_CONTAM: hypothetical protein LVR18_41720 [Planctomycetaceae bacterium]|jgi:hypothetical protein
MSLILDSPRPSAGTATTTTAEAAASGRVPRWLCWSASSPLVLAVVGLIFLYLTRLPLWHSDIWDHLNYGREMLQTGRIARTEPLLTLCEGVRMVNLPWLAELALTLVEQTTGIVGLQFLSAVLAFGQSAGDLPWGNQNQSFRNRRGVRRGWFLLCQQA